MTDSTIAVRKKRGKQLVEDDMDDLKARIEAWVARPEFATEMAASQKLVEQAVREFRETIKLDREEMRQPCTI